MKRHPNNPIFSPSENAWENFAVFNPSLVPFRSKWRMLYRAIGDVEEIRGKELRVSRLGIASSDDGIQFNDRRIFLEPNTPFNAFGCEDPRVTFFEGKYYIFYTALGGFPFSRENIKVALAVSSDLETIDEHYLITPFNAKAMALFPERINGKITALLSVNTDNPPAHCAVIQVDRMEELYDPMMWYNWYSTYMRNALELSRLNSDHVEVGCPPIRCKEGWLLIYCHINDYGTKGANAQFRFEAALLDHDNPAKVIGRTLEPVLEEQETYEKVGTVPNVIFPTSLVADEDKYHLYYGATDTTVSLASESKSALHDKIQKEIKVVPKASKLHFPIITPRFGVMWEANGVFNPGCWDDGKNIHVFYRAQSKNWTSQIGYARLNTPYNIEFLSDEPVYKPRASFETKVMEECYSGCEDPRLTQIGDTVYMLYTAFDGVNPPLVALTHIKAKNIQQGKWDWAEPKLISRPGKMDKNAMMFPEVISGNYLLLHRIEPHICIHSISEDKFPQMGVSEFLHGGTILAKPENTWESAKIGANCSPMRTAEGWLLIYHGVDKRDSQYRVGSMLLDLDNPQKIIARTPFPFLEPTLPWEQLGVVPNVTFPCGATIRNEQLFIYYGGADTVVGVAMIPLSQVMEAMLPVRQS